MDMLANKLADLEAKTLPTHKRRHMVTNSIKKRSRCLSTLWVEEVKETQSKIEKYAGQSSIRYAC